MGRTRRIGGFENSYVALYCRNQYISSLSLPRVRSPAEGFCYEAPLRQPWGANTQSVVGDDHKK